jgi:hypothetical protein
MRQTNLTGLKFNRLSILECIGISNAKRWYNCLCDCGNIITAVGSSVKYGNTKSCGCLNTEKRIENGKKFKTHGDRLHGEHKRIYRIWSSMKTRCKNDNYKNRNYYGKGISLCHEWDDYLTFKKWALSNGYEETLTIDRIDNSGNYEPSNCRWATISVQSNNKSTNRPITYMGETRNVNEWARHLGVGIQTLKSRLGKYNMSLEKALTKKLYRNA